MYIAPPREHSHTLHCNSSYHVLVSGIIVESWTVPIQAMVGAACSENPEDKLGSCSSRVEGIDGSRRGQKNWREKEMEKGSRVGKY